MDAAIKRFESKGVHVSESGGSQGRWAYFDTDVCGGVTIELIWSKPH
jgi:hypothetical protein